MENVVLNGLMDKLGQLMHDYDVAMAEFEKAHEAEAQKITELKDTIREEILKRQEGYKSMKLECSWRKGAVRWDGDKLKQYEKAYPFLKECKKTGEPTVGFRVRSEGMGDE